MTEQFPNPIGDADDDGGMPEHEQGPDRTVGGGLMSEGGTAVERGTDTLTGPAAQGPFAGEDGGTSSFPSVVDFDDHSRMQGDDPATPGLDDYTEGREAEEDDR